MTTADWPVKITITMAMSRRRKQWYPPVTSDSCCGCSCRWCCCLQNAVVFMSSVKTSATHKYSTQPPLPSNDAWLLSLESKLQDITKAPSTPATMSKQHCRMLQVERFFRQSRNKLNMFNLFRLCRKDEISFDIVAETGNIVAKNGSNVDATFEFVERILFYDKLVWHCCRFWQQSRMLLRQSRTFLWHCCWCGRGISNIDIATLSLGLHEYRVMLLVYVERSITTSQPGPWNNCGQQRNGSYKAVLTDRLAVSFFYSGLPYFSLRYRPYFALVVLGHMSLA